MVERILIVVDDDAATPSAIAQGLQHAKVHGAEVVFLYVLPGPATLPMAGDVMPLGCIAMEENDRHAKSCAQQVLREAADQAHAQGLHSRQLMAEGTDTAASVAEQAAALDCDLIVVGSHGRNALQRLVYGSLPASLLPLTPIPMLVCKSPEFVATHPLPHRARAVAPQHASQ